ncbi:trypsin-like peptidase domain-containing protein [Micromonospora zhanjiangensis]|uniref:Trypsin-like peptidase domain-containing protein n=1 Tax=Micromonospora zhanjiangensis TaxID=1522057 RepID=A0ABV8KHL9_9ACTN
MPLRRALRRRLGASLLALATLPGPILLAPTGAGAAVPTYGVDERAQAVASPALVFLEVTYKGVIRDKASGRPLEAGTKVVSRRCSGFVVNPDGQVLTTGVCVQPSHDVVRLMTFYSVGRARVDKGQLTEGQLNGFVDGLMKTADFTGEQPGTQPEATLRGQLNVATAGQTGKPAIGGTVVAAQKPDDGNLALVKLDQGGLPAVEINRDAGLGRGSTAVILGFDTKDVDGDHGTYTVQAKLVDVITLEKVDYLKVSEDVGPYSHGGMAVDNNGRVVAMLDADPGVPERPNRKLVGTDVLADFLGKNNVRNELGDADRAYRRGLDAYFAGRYSTAIREFDATPSNLLANVYRRNASDRYAVEGDAVENSADWLGYGLSAAGGALLILLITLGWRYLSWRRRPGAAPAPFAGDPYAPVSGGGPFPMSGPPAPWPTSGGGTPMTSGPPSPYEGTGWGPHSGPPAGTDHPAPHEQRHPDTEPDRPGHF